MFMGGMVSDKTEDKEAMMNLRTDDMPRSDFAFFKVVISAVVLTSVCFTFFTMYIRYKEFVLLSQNADRFDLTYKI